MTDSAPTVDPREQLANRISELLDGHPLDISATALSMNLAAVIAGYGARGRETAETSITQLLHARVEQLAAAGLEPTDN